MMFPSSELLVRLNQLLEKIMEGEIFQNYEREGSMHPYVI